MLQSVEDQGEPQADSVKPVAVIDIGTASIRMAVAEIDGSADVRILETLSQAVSLGKDTFASGAIEKTTIEACARVLKSYRRVLEEYQITRPNQIRVVATSAVREAKNRLAFIDRIYIATGFNVEPIDEAEENRVTYLGILPHLRAEPALASARTLVVEVGGGSTETLVVRGGNVLSAHSHRLGSLRLRETLEAYQTPTGKVRGIMQRQIERTVRQIREDVPPNGAVQMIALGSDVRHVTLQLMPDWNPATLARLPVSALEDFTHQVLELSDEEIVSRYHLSFQDAEMLGPALLTYVQLAHAFRLENVLVSNANLRDGLLKELAVRSAWTKELADQAFRSAIALGRRYDFDETHACHVADTARQLFAQLTDEHKLDQRHEVILSLAALLHEIGLYVRFQSHHKHSMYLIRNSELFGVGGRDLLLTAMVARYYRRASPQPTHEGYSRLTRNERVSVAKLAAILRVAVALDDSRSQRISRFSCQRQDHRLVISIPNIEDLSLEQLAIRQNGALFEETYGLQVLLRPARDTQ